jgi:hypothetical protein
MIVCWLFGHRPSRIPSVICNTDSYVYGHTSCTRCKVHYDFEIGLPPLIAYRMLELEQQDNWYLELNKKGKKK